MLTYLFEVTLCWTLFYLLFFALLRKETFYNINRWFLLSTLVLGLAIPLLRFLPISFYQEDVAEYIPLVYVIQDAPSAIANTINTSIATATVSVTPSFNWVNLLQYALLAIYGLGCLWFLARLCKGLYSIRNLYLSGERSTKDGYTLIHTQKPHLPFSFFSNVFISKSLPLDKAYNHVIQHELSHVQSKHSFDVLLVEIINIIFWFHPLVYLYKTAIRQTHEYAADAQALHLTSRKVYGQILLKQSLSGIEVALVHNFFNNHIKKRISMMYQQKSKRSAFAKYLVLLPLIAVLFFAFTANKENSVTYEIDSSIETSKEAFRYGERHLVQGEMHEGYQWTPLTLSFPKNVTEGTIDLKELYHSIKVEDLKENEKLEYSFVNYKEIDNLIVDDNNILNFSIDDDHSATDHLDVIFKIAPIISSIHGQGENGEIVLINDEHKMDIIYKSHFRGDLKIKLIDGDSNIFRTMNRTKFTEEFPISFRNNLFHDKGIVKIIFEELDQNNLTKSISFEAKKSAEAPTPIIDWTKSVDDIDQAALFFSSNSHLDFHINYESKYIGKFKTKISFKDGSAPRYYDFHKPTAVFKMTPSHFNLINKGPGILEVFEGDNTQPAATLSFNFERLKKQTNIERFEINPEREKDNTVFAIDPSKGIPGHEIRIFPSANSKSAVFDLFKVYKKLNPQTQLSADDLYYYITYLDDTKASISSIDTKGLSSIVSKNKYLPASMVLEVVLSPKETFEKYGVQYSPKKQESRSKKVKVTAGDKLFIEGKDYILNNEGQVVIHNNSLVKDGAPVLISPANDNEPLHVIDGEVLVTDAKLRELKEEDIESINVLKGEKALEKYGDRANNGAVEITTKNKQHNISADKIKLKTNAKEKPLFVIDGVIQPIGEDAVEEIDPDDIERINVIKNQAALDKYGSATQHGVVEIITKKNAKAQVSGGQLYVINGNIAGYGEQVIKNINTNQVQSMTLIGARLTKDKYGIVAPDGASEINIDFSTTSKKKTNFKIEKIKHKKGQKRAQLTYHSKTHKDPLILIDGKAVTLKYYAEDLDRKNIISTTFVSPEQGFQEKGEQAKYGIISVITKKGVVQIRPDDEASPLLVIDGIAQPKKKDAIKEISPDDIESINVLKNKKATDKYGQDGSDGVIEVITKKKSNLEKTLDYPFKVELQPGETTNEADEKNLLVVYDGKILGFGYDYVKELNHDGISRVELNKNSEEYPEYGIVDVYNITSLTADQSPLYILDNTHKIRGLEMPFHLTDDDIATISFINGQKAIDTYGEEGKYGVYMVTTKKNIFGKETTDKGALNNDDIKLQLNAYDDGIVVRLIGSSKESGKVFIYDMAGRILYNQTHPPFEGQEIIQVKGPFTGILAVTYQSKNTFVTEKLFVK